MIPASRSIRVLAVAVLVPAAIIAAFGWVSQDRSEATDRIPVAIVNEDTIITDPIAMAAGRELAAALISPPEAGQNLGWTLTGAEAAADGLATGEYAAILTIPNSFSADVLSVSDDQPRSATILIETTASAPAAGLIASEAASMAAAAIGEQVTATFVTGALGGLTDVSSAIADAAEAGGDLSDGARSAAEGAQTLSEGSTALVSGLSELSTGTEQLVAGSRTAREASDRLAAGAFELAAGVDGLVPGVNQLTESSGHVATGTQLLVDALVALSASCADSGASREYCEQSQSVVEQATGLSTLVEASASGATFASDAVTGLAEGTKTVSLGATELADGLNLLETESQSLATGAAAAAEGAHELATGMAELADGNVSLFDGATAMVGGLTSAANTIPSHSSVEAEQIAEVVAAPVTVNQTMDGSNAVVSTLLAVGIGSVLWFAAVMVSRITGQRRSVTSPIVGPSASLVWRVTLPGMLVGAAQGGAASLFLVATGVPISDSSALGLAVIVGSVAFTAIATAVRAWLPHAATSLLLAAFVVQIPLSGVLFPLATLPDALQGIGAVLPLGLLESASVAALTGTAGVGSASIGLMWWFAGAFLVAAFHITRWSRSSHQAPLMVRARKARAA